MTGCASSARFTTAGLASCCCAQGLQPGQRFVEFGCGLGYVARWAAGQGAYATGIDLNPEQIRRGRWSGT